MNEEPCKFCEQYPNSLLFGVVTTDDGKASLASASIHGNRLVLISNTNPVDEMMIDYCPMCGRKL